MFFCAPYDSDDEPLPKHLHAHNVLEAAYEFQSSHSKSLNIHPERVPSFHILNCLRTESDYYMDLMLSAERDCDSDVESDFSEFDETNCREFADFYRRMQASCNESEDEDSWEIDVDFSNLNRAVIADPSFECLTTDDLVKQDDDAMDIPVVPTQINFIPQASEEPCDESELGQTPLPMSPTRRPTPEPVPMYTIQRVRRSVSGSGHTFFAPLGTSTHHVPKRPGRIAIRTSKKSLLSGSSSSTLTPTPFNRSASFGGKDLPPTPMTCRSSIGGAFLPVTPALGKNVTNYSYPYLSLDTPCTPDVHQGQVLTPVSILKQNSLTPLARKTVTFSPYVEYR